MYRRFAFEGDVHTALDCVPLAVRRKLDLAALKISLAGWQSLDRAERLALCLLPVDTEDDLEAYKEIYKAFAARKDVELKELPPADPSSWSRASLAPSIVERARELGVELSWDRWASLDEEERYAVVKYADPKREPAKLLALLRELGL